MTRSVPYATAATLAIGAFIAAPVQAETYGWTVNLSGASVVPPVETEATGTAELTLDTEAKTVRWTLTTDGLSGDPTAAHIHGPAAEGENAAPVIDLSGSMDEGSAEIDDAQIEELESGMYYVNVHTEANPDGEIRGQITEAAAR